MGVGLQPLEFTECITDSPQFRENLQRHEKELEHTSQQIKRLIKEVKDVVQAAKRLGAAQLALATSLEQFEFACIGAHMTEDERVIGDSLHHFAHLIRTIEDERTRMLGCAQEQIILPLEKFRKDHIGAVKEGKKKFEKKTAKFYQGQERTLSLSTKKPDAVFKEAEAALKMAEGDFCKTSLEYVLQLQAVQERKKFELVETLLGFVFGWWTFHHTAHDIHADAEPLMRDLQLRIQRTRTNFEETSEHAKSLMMKMIEMRQMSKEDEGKDEGGGGSRAGYVFLMEKKAFGTTWTKHYCQYDKTTRMLSLTPYNQINVKALGVPESVCISGCRGCTEPLERRYCWEAQPARRERPPLLLQALGERDRSAWLHAASDIQHHMKSNGLPASESGCALDENGFNFIKRLISTLEARGLDEQGLYRIAGVSSKVSRLVHSASEGATVSLESCETKTLASAVKGYLRGLPEPLLSRRLHDKLIAAAKLECRSERVSQIASLVRALPQTNYEMLQLVITHLKKVAALSEKNLMTSSNLAVCFGPTLLRAEKETVASILELKFYNVVVETLLDHYDIIFQKQTHLQQNGRAFQLEAKSGDQRTSADIPTSSNVPDVSENSFIRLEEAFQSEAKSGERTSADHLTNSNVPDVSENSFIRLEDASPASIPMSARNDISMGGMGGKSELGGSSGLLSVVARYSPHHHQLIQHFATPPYPLRPGRSSSSSVESVSMNNASPTGPMYRHARVRTIYACVGDGEGELSFEQNQIITNVAPSPEPGWLRGTLNGKTGLIPENYVQPLP